jgi:predicted transcriptional regulator
MKPNRVVIRAADEAEFFAAAKEAARRADRGEPFDSAITLSFEDPRRMLDVLTKNRQALVREVICAAPEL